MPQLPTQGELKRITLQSTAELPPEQQAYVVLQTGKVLGGDIANVENPENNLGVAMAILAGRIKEWNFTDEQGKTTPITLENVKRLEMGDMTALFGELDLNNVSGLSGDQKKSS